MRIRGINYPIEETVKNKIIHCYDEYCTYSYNYAIPTLQGETTFFELFTKQQNNPEQSNCEMINCEIRLPSYSVNYGGNEITGKDALKNYITNVGGSVTQICGDTAYINVPKDAFGLNTLEFKLMMFFHDFEDISGRYDLIYNEGKNMPTLREERKYMYNLDDSIWTEMFAAIVVIVFSLLLMI